MKMKNITLIIVFSLILLLSCNQSIFEKLDAVKDPPADFHELVKYKFIKDSHISNYDQ